MMFDSTQRNYYKCNEIAVTSLNNENDNQRSSKYGGDKENERLYNKKMNDANSAKVIFSFRLWFGLGLVKFIDYGSKGFYVNVHNLKKKDIKHYKCPKWFADALVEINNL